MKKIITICIIMVLLTAISLSFFGCTKSIDDVIGTITDALDESSKSPFYYYKESRIVADDRLNSLRVNLLGSFDKENQPMYDANGNIVNYRLSIVDSTIVGIKENTNASTYCGYTSIADSKNKTSYLLKSVGDKQTVETMGIESYLQSEDFAPYSLMYKLTEVERLTDSDINVISAVTKNKIQIIKFTINESYLGAYKAEFGTDSIFANTERVEIEITYGKLSALTCYVKMKDKIAQTVVEKEAYKLYITYVGPKFAVPTIKKDNKGNLSW